VAKIEDSTPKNSGRSLTEPDGHLPSGKSCRSHIQKTGTGETSFVIKLQECLDPGPLSSLQRLQGRAHQVGKIAALELAEIGFGQYGQSMRSSGREVSSKLWTVGEDRMSRGADYELKSITGSEIFSRLRPAACGMSWSSCEQPDPDRSHLSR